MKQITQLNSRSGVAMASAVITVFATAALVAVLLTMAVATDRSSGVTRRSAQAQYIAEGAVEIASKTVQESIANWKTPPTAGTATIDGVEVNYTVTPMTTVAGDLAQTVLTDAAGIQTIVTTYEISATAQMEEDVARVSRVVSANSTPIFQFAVFYTGDLEVNPGPDMTLGGRVHSNGNIHLAPGAALQLNTNYVRAVGDIYRCRKDDPFSSTGNVTIRKWVENPFDGSEPTQYATMYNKTQLAALGATSWSGYDSLFNVGHDANADGDFGDLGDFKPFSAGSLDMWSQPAGYETTGNTVLTSDHWIKEAVTPFIGSIKMFEEQVAGAGDHVLDEESGLYEYVGAGNGNFAKGFYHSKAALSFIVNPDNTVSVFGPDGNTENEAGVSYASLLSGVYSLKTIYDARQAEQGNGYVTVVEVDLALLNPLIDPAGSPVIDLTEGSMDNNGVVLYSAKYGAGTGLSTGGIKVKNGAQLALPLTVVSESPIYVQGDFNVGGATYPKTGAAAIGDAVNLLSNAWNDTKTPASGKPTASNTTFNVALITGNQESAVGKYNGGLENLPRFHENWSGRTCTIKGSFVNTWGSDLATGKWVYGGKIYEAPRRNYRYDTDFNDIGNLPPFTPVAVSAQDVVTW